MDLIPGQELKGLRAMLASPTYGPVDPFCQKTLRTAMMSASNHGLFWAGDVSPDKQGFGTARNMAAQSLVDHPDDADGIVWVDSDIVLENDSLLKLLGTVRRTGYDFVCGIYHKKGAPYDPVIYWYEPDLDSYCSVESFNPGFVTEIGACGFGFVWTGIKVLLAIQANKKHFDNEGKWFPDTRYLPKESKAPDGRPPFGEDFNFPVSHDTPILGRDWAWRPISDFRIGDKLIAFDNEPVVRCSGRRMREAIVTNLIHKSLPTVKISTECGEIITTDEHPWLHRKYNRAAWNWTPSSQVRTGDFLAEVMPVERSPNISNELYAAGYVCGLIQSDGTLSMRNGSPHIVIAMKDKEPLVRFESCMSRLSIHCTWTPKPSWDGNPKHAEMNRVGVYRSSETIKTASLFNADDGSTDYAAGFLAGIYDGDGHHSNGILLIASIHSEIRQKIIRFAERIGVTGWVDSNKAVRLCGRYAIYRFWMRTRPALLRRTHLDGQLGNDGIRRGKEIDHRPIRVMAVEKSTKKDVMCLTTSSGTFIAAGLGSHNCDKARMAGIQLYVDTGVLVGHKGDGTIFDRNAYLKWLSENGGHLKPPDLEAWRG